MAGEQPQRGRAASPLQRARGARQQQLMQQRDGGACQPRLALGALRRTGGVGRVSGGKQESGGHAGRQSITAGLWEFCWAAATLPPCPSAPRHRGCGPRGARPAARPWGTATQGRWPPPAAVCSQCSARPSGSAGGWRTRWPPLRKLLWRGAGRGGVSGARFAGTGGGGDVGGPAACGPRRPAQGA